MRPACSTWATATASTTSAWARRAPSRRCFCMVARGVASRLSTGACSTRPATTCCCSTNAAAASPPRMRAWRPTPPGTWWTTSRPCGNCGPAPSAGWCSAAPGSTLALAYAQKHPQRVSELVLRGVYTVTRAELDWYYQYGVSEMFPEKWARFQAPVPEAERGHMMAAYHRLLTGPD